MVDEIKFDFSINYSPNAPFNLKGDAETVVYSINSKSVIL
jgi:hypothetical protein